MIVPENKTIEDILKGSYTLSIPRYQRSYDWGKGEIQELISDLKDVDIKNGRELFLGNFIFDTKNKIDYKIVDGQQRLTTISLILIAIRQQAKLLNDFNTAARIQQLITIDSVWGDNQGNKIIVSDNIKYLFNYISNYEWDGKFPDKIDGKGVKHQVNKLKPIINYVQEEISGYNIGTLKEFSRALLTAYVILVKIEDEQDVFSIFERTNARGLDLNIGDLLKNYIFAYNIDKFEDKWTEIIENASGGLQRMLKYFWISRRGYVLQSLLYKNLKFYVKELDDGHGTNKGIDIFVDELYYFSRYYKTSISQDRIQVKEWLSEIGLSSLSTNEAHYERISRVFQALKLFRVTQPIPLIYSIFRHYINCGSNNTNKLFEALEKIEHYHFVNNVISGRIGNEVEKFYAEKAQFLLNSNKDFIKNIDTFLCELGSKKAKKEEFVVNFVDIITYNESNIQLINYVFDRINNIGTKGGQYFELFSPDKDLSKRNHNIEHILAQSKKTYTVYSESELEAFDKIGNLLVISRHTNSELQDKSPLDKINIIKADKKHYGNLRYIDDFIEKYDSEFEKWNFDSIHKRSIAIAELGYTTIWNF